MDLSGPIVRDLIEANYESLYRYAYRLSGSSVEAEDLTQETFSRALTRIGQLREPDRVKYWLYRILRNEYLHRARKARRQHCVPIDAIGDLATEEPEPTTDIDPKALQAALDDLDESFRTPLILYYFEDFSYRDIAEQMELPIGTVMSRLARAKAYLRRRLAPDVDLVAEGQRRPRGL